MKQNRATLFGLPNSPEAYELRDFLKRSGFPFEWIDLKTDDDARRLAGVTGLNDPRLPVCIMEKVSRCTGYVEFRAEHDLLCPFGRPA